MGYERGEGHVGQPTLIPRVVLGASTPLWFMSCG